MQKKKMKMQISYLKHSSTLLPYPARVSLITNLWRVAQHFKATNEHCMLMNNEEVLGVKRVAATLPTFSQKCSKHFTQQALSEETGSHC